MRLKLRSAVVLLLIAIMAATAGTADAKLFGRRRAARGGGGGGVQTFPSGTPPAAAPACVGPNCPMPAPTIAPAPAVELSIVVQKSDSIDDAAAEVEAMKLQLAQAEASLKRLQLLAERNARLDSVRRKHANELQWLALEDDIDDLKTEQLQLGGGQSGSDGGAAE